MSTLTKSGVIAFLALSTPCFAQKPLSPDGRSLVYYAKSGENNHDLFLLDVETPDTALKLTTTPEHEYNPSWHPGGQRVLYHRGGGAGDSESDYDLVLLDLRSGESLPVVDTPYHDADGVFSPDGASIAFNSDRDGDHEIFVCAEDGTGTRQLTKNDTADFSPHWSPDGQLIAYVSKTGDGTYDLFVIHSDGTNTRRLTWGGGELYRPVWSPDGTRLVFMGRRAGSAFDVYTLDMDRPGALPVKLTDSPSDDDTPFWLLDGRIAFYSDRDGSDSIFAMTRDGRDVRAWVVIPALR